MADKKPGDLSRLGRTDPLDRDASWLPQSSYGGTRTNAEWKDIGDKVKESMRREFRQSEDASIGNKYGAARKKKSPPLTPPPEENE